MARSAKKSVYERIEEKQEEIALAENTLKRLNDELQELFSEKDKLEMEQLLRKVRESNMDIEQALSLLGSNKSEK